MQVCQWPFVAAGDCRQHELCGCQVLHTVVGRAPAKEAAKAQAVLAPPLARAAMEPAPDVREAALQARPSPFHRDRAMTGAFGMPLLHSHALATCSASQGPFPLDGRWSHFPICCFHLAQTQQQCIPAGAGGVCNDGKGRQGHGARHRQCAGRQAAQAAGRHGGSRRQQQQRQWCRQPRDSTSRLSLFHNSQLRVCTQMTFHGGHFNITSSTGSQAVCSVAERSWVLTCDSGSCSQTSTTSDGVTAGGCHRTWGLCSCAASSQRFSSLWACGRRRRLAVCWRHGPLAGAVCCHCGTMCCKQS